MIDVMASNGMLVLLTLLAVGLSGRPALMLLLGGALMISITAGYVKDGGGKLLKLAQLFLVVLFAFFAGSWWGFLVFACLLWPKPLELFLFTDGALLAELIAVLALPHLRTVVGILDDRLPRILASWLLCLSIVDGIVGVTILLRFLLKKQREKEEESYQRIKNYSLGEMHEIQRNKELAKQNFYIDKNARLIERENISRNIHNSVGHSITAAIMTLDAADVLFEKKPEEAHKKMNDATERIRGSLGAIRSAVRALDEEAGDVAVKDLICYFDNILDEFLMDTERTCDSLYEYRDLEAQLPREHAEFLTGALEECLTNGVMHGDASHFVVKLSGDVAHMRLEVKDNGRSRFDDMNGAELIRNGFGLKKLISYAERCGGAADFQNEEGFCSVIELQIQARN